MSGMISPTQLYRDYFHKPLYIRIPSLNNQDDSWKVRDPVVFFRGAGESPPLGHPLPLRIPLNDENFPNFKLETLTKSLRTGMMVYFFHGHGLVLTWECQKS